LGPLSDLEIEAKDRVDVLQESAPCGLAAGVKTNSASAFLWLICAMVVDFVGFVLIKNPWSMTPHELYVEYQPWITLIYISIFLGPWIRLGVSRLRMSQAR
jgi:hypothetical protein